MKEKTKKGIRRTLSVQAMVLVFALLFATVAAAAVIFFRSLVVGKGEIGSGDLDGSAVTLTVTELHSGTAVSAATGAFTLKKAGDSAKFSVALENGTTEDLTHRLSFALSGLSRSGAALSSDLAAAVKSSILVYTDGVFAGTLAHLTEAGEYSLPDLAYLPGKAAGAAKTSDAHTFEFVLHAAADVYAGTTVSLALYDRAENADARDLLFLKSEEDFAHAVSDINSGLLLGSDGAVGVPRLVLAKDISLAGAYTVTRPFILDLRGHTLTGGGSITLRADTTVTSSALYDSVPAFGVSLVLDSDGAALDLRDLTTKDGAYAAGNCVAAVTVNAFSAEKVSALLSSRLKANLGDGFSGGETRTALSSLAFYLSDKVTLTPDGCTLSGDTVAAAVCDATHPASLTLSVGGAEDSVCHFKVFGQDDEAVLQALRNGPLAHLEALNGTAESITSDLFLPTFLREYGTSIEWQSGSPDVISSEGRIRDVVTDGETVTLYAIVHINESTYTLSYSFAVSSINNSLRFSNFIAQLSPLTLKEVWRGNTDTASEDFRKSHQFLPVTVSSSSYHYTKAFTSPADASLTTAQLIWEGYEDIGLETLTYSQDATYNYVSVYTNAAGEQAVFLNTPVFSSFAQINLSATFTGDDEVYSGTVNIIIETGNYEELLDEVFHYIQKQYDATDLYLNTVLSRMQVGMAQESGEFFVDTIYSISASSTSSSKYAITLDTAGSDLFTATETKLQLDYNGRTCAAWIPVDAALPGAVAGSGNYIKIGTSRGTYYLSAADAGITDGADGENIIDGTGMYFAPVTAGYTVKADLTRASQVETRAPLSVTVRYTGTADISSTRTLYVTVPAVLLPDENGFSNYSVFSAVKYRLAACLPAAEQTRMEEAFTVSDNTVTNHTAAYILLKDIERCSGAAGDWFSGEYAGEDRHITYGSKLDTLRLYVKAPDPAVNRDDQKVYDFLRLLQWATGNKICSPTSVVSGSYSDILPATATSDGKEYMTPDELAVLKNFYRNVTGLSDSAWEALIASVTETPTFDGVPSRVLTDPVAFDNAIRGLTTNSQLYFKHTELMRWALNEQNFPKKAFFDNSYPIGNPPNAGSFTYDTTYTTASGNGYYFRQTGTNSLQSGYFNEDDTAYISEREEVVLQAFWNKAGRLSGFKTAFANYTVRPTYLKQNAVQVLVSTLYTSLGYPKEYAAGSVTEGGQRFPTVTSADGSLSGLVHFSHLTTLTVSGEVNVVGTYVSAGLPAFLHTGSLADSYNRLAASGIAGQLTELTLHNCAQDHVTFDPDGLSAFSALRRLDLGMNYGLKSVGAVLDANYKQLTYLDVSGADCGDLYQSYPLAVFHMAGIGTVLYSHNSGVTDGGKEVVRDTLTDGTTSELLAYLKELSSVDGQYLQLQKKLGSTDIYWQADNGNRIYSTPVTDAGVFTPGTYGTASTAADMLAQLTNAYYCTADMTVDGVALKAGYVYPIIRGADGSFTYDVRNGKQIPSISSAPTLTDNELAELMGQDPGDTVYGFTLVQNGTPTTATGTVTQVYNTSTSVRVAFGGASTTGLNDYNSTSYRYIYYIPTTTTTRYNFTYRGTAEATKTLLAYLAASDEVVEYTYAYGKSGEVTGTVSVAYTVNTYYGNTQRNTTTNSTQFVFDDTATYLYYRNVSGWNSSYNTRNRHAIVQPQYTASYTYNGSTVTRTISENTTAILRAGIENAFSVKADVDTLIDNATASYTTTQKTYTMSVPEIGTVTEASAALARLSQIVSGVPQEVSVFRYSGATGSGTYYGTDGAAVSYGFTRNRFYRLVWENGRLTWEDTKITYSATTGPTMESLLAEANRDAATVRRGNWLGMYVFYKDYETGDSQTAADRTVTVNGRSYTPGLVYRIVWADESHTAFTYDNADGGQRVGRSVSDSEFNALPYNAPAAGGFYYLKGTGNNANFYGRGRFYTMVRDEGGFMYLRTVGDAILLLSEDVDGSDDSTAMRIKNNRLYFSTAEDYSGTGGTEYVDIVAIVIADGVEYRRTFRVAMIG